MIFRLKISSSGSSLFSLFLQSRILNIVVIKMYQSFEDVSKRNEPKQLENFTLNEEEQGENHKKFGGLNITKTSSILCYSLL